MKRSHEILANSFYHIIVFLCIAYFHQLNISPTSEKWRPPIEGEFVPKAGAVYIAEKFEEGITDEAITQTK